MLDSALLWGGLAGYGAGAVVAVRGAWNGQRVDHLVLMSLVVGVSMLTIVIVERWLSIGHGPFLTMFEILLSNLFSLGLIYALLYWRVSLVRAGAVVVMPVLLLMSAWLINTSPAPGQLPATFDNYWLWIHVGLGKVFLGVALAATGLAGISLVAAGRPRIWRMHIPREDELDSVAWRLMAIAFVFHSLMMVAGAVWANDAWGRFWAWDPLETWAFVTWLFMGVSLHARLTYKLASWAGPLMIIATFILAFLTFFGVPFFSVAPHKGVM